MTRFARQDALGRTDPARSIEDAVAVSVGREAAAAARPIDRNRFGGVPAPQKDTRREVAAARRAFEAFSTPTPPDRAA